MSASPEDPPVYLSHDQEKSPSYQKNGTPYQISNSSIDYCPKYVRYMIFCIVYVCFSAPIFIWTFVCAVMTLVNNNCYNVQGSVYTTAVCMIIHLILIFMMIVHLIRSLCIRKKIISDPIQSGYFISRSNVIGIAAIVLWGCNIFILPIGVGMASQCSSFIMGMIPWFIHESIPFIWFICLTIFWTFRALFEYCGPIWCS
jgi:hypothetical protein